MSHTTSAASGETDPGRYVRWMQFGAFSPSCGSTPQNLQTRRLPWEFASPYRGAAAATCASGRGWSHTSTPAARVAHETGLPMARSMYSTGRARRRPTGSNTSTCSATTYSSPPSPGWDRPDLVPAGRWVGAFDGTTIVGPTVQTVRVRLRDIPVYARAGSVPMLAAVAPAAVAVVPIALRIHVGTDGRSRLYHDDGHSHDHRCGAYSWTTMTWNDAEMSLTTNTESATGYGRPPIERIELVGIDAAPTGVSIDRREVPDSAWTFDRRTRTASADLEHRSAGSAERAVGAIRWTLHPGRGARSAFPDHLGLGLRRRLRHRGRVRIGGTGPSGLRPQLRRVDRGGDDGRERVCGHAPGLCPGDGAAAAPAWERPVYLAGLLIVAASMLACAFAQSYWRCWCYALGGSGR